LKKQNIKSRFRVSGIWPLNPTIMVGKCDPINVFIATKKEEHELSYYSNLIDEFNSNEAKATPKLLNIARTFQVELPTIHDCPLSPMQCYYVKMLNSPGIAINNHEEDQLMADLEDVTLES
jgi:hypothetical protein